MDFKGTGEETQICCGVEDAEGMTLRDVKLTRRIALLERQLADYEPEARGGGQKSKRFDT